MRELTEAWRSLWRSSGAAPKLVFATALATTVYYVVFGFVAGVVAEYAAFSLATDRLGIFVESLFSGVTLAASLAIVQVAIGLALRSSSPLYRLLGSVSALIPGLVASGFFLQVLGAIEAGEAAKGTAAILEPLLWGPFVVMSAIYVVVALLGFADLVRAALRATGGQPLARPR